MERKPFFISFEGIDGAGTTTQTKILKEKLEGKNFKVHLTGEPSGGLIGSLIRNILKKRIIGRGCSGEEIPFNHTALALLFAADRIDHYFSEIAPLLNEGLIVISDRYVLSSIAYQSLNNSVLWVKEINRYAPSPDLTIFIDVPVKISMMRLQRSRVMREIFENEEQQRKILELYKDSFDFLEKQKLFIVDGDREKEVVADEIFDIVRKFLQI